MGAFLTISETGEISTGMDLMQMATFLKKISKDNPDAVLNMSDAMVTLSKGLGVGVVSVLHDGGTSTSRFDATQKDCMVVVAGGSVAQIVPQDPTHAWTIEVTPAGEAHHKKGVHNTIVGRPTHANSETQAILEWLYDGNVGQSSLSVAQHLHLIPHGENANRKVSRSVPADTADFSRCAALLERAPFLNTQMAKMAQVSKEWEQLMAKDKDGKSLWEEGLEHGRKMLANSKPAPSNAGVYPKVKTSDSTTPVARLKI